jgi:uncharacterized protein
MAAGGAQDRRAMNQSRTEPGQSMEEILASIRRIIAEGERETEQAGAPSPATGEVGGAKEGRREQPPTIGTETEILVLTEMLQEDGSVVSLQPGRMPETSTSMGKPGAGQAQDTSDLTHTINKPSDEPAEHKVAESTEPFAVPETSPPAQAEQEAERSPLSGEPSKKPELVSEATLEASTAALAQLAQSVSRTRDTPGSSRTVEDLVREAIEPMLKQWLDANLSRIVERMVREAIERVVRRVE